jgi:hypothetical protein
MFMSHHQNERKNEYIKMANKSFENVTNLKYSGAEITIKITFMKKLMVD